MGKSKQYLLTLCNSQHDTLRISYFYNISDLRILISN